MTEFFLRKSILRLAAASLSSQVAAALLVALSASTFATAAPGDQIYLHPGRLVTADGAQLNLYCTGSGSPTVLFDSGHQDWAPAWAVVQPEVSKWTRACSFDRPGYGFSPPGPMPRTSERIATELHDALKAAGVAGPYLLVGHAFGGYNMRAFAYRYLSEVQGLVLIDTDAGDTVGPDMDAKIHGVFVHQAEEIQQCRDALAAHCPVRPPSRATSVSSAASRSRLGRMH